MCVCVYHINFSTVTSLVFFCTLYNSESKIKHKYCENLILSDSHTLQYSHDTNLKYVFRFAESPLSQCYNFNGDFCLQSTLN